MEYNPLDFGIVGVVLIFAWKVIELLASVAHRRLNGYPDNTPCEKAIEHLATIVETYVGEDRAAHTELVRTLTRQEKKLGELWTAHLGPAAINPKTGTPRWWEHGE